jgi:hypothetical protein
MVSDLPFIDEFDTLIEAPSIRVFTALSRTVGRSFEGFGGRAFTALLGCRHRGATSTVPPSVGQEINGFRVAEVSEPESLVLEGEHRFARYRLAFVIEPSGEGRSRLRARTDALFPGLRGSVYRALVIGSGGHAFMARRLLAVVARAAVRDQNRDFAS